MINLILALLKQVSPRVRALIELAEKAPDEFAWAKGIFGAMIEQQLLLRAV
jgi:hypothetical protein